jgi:hypothetical protein
MDATILALTMALEIVMLAGLFYRKLFLVIPWFTICILACLLQGPWLLYIQRTGSARQYFLSYYAVDLINIAFYTVAIRECCRKGYFCAISFTMGIYLGCKAFSYLYLVDGEIEQALNLHGQLRFLNLVCYVIWAFMVWGYDVFGLKFRTR